MSEDFKRLSDAVIRAREARGWSERDLAYACELARTTTRGLEAGTRRVSDYAYRQVERALGWAPGSVEAILQGGDPTTDEDATETA